MKSFDDLELDRDDSLDDWFRWYFHPRKFLLDNALHVAIGFAVLLPIALAADFPRWSGGLAAAFGAIPREVKQWPPRRMPVFGRAWFDPVVDVAFFGVGGIAAAFVPSLLGR